MLRKLVGYTAVMFGATLFTGLLTFAVNALGMRLLSKTTFGDYNTYVRIYGLAQGVFFLGVNQAIQRMAVNDGESRVRFAKLAYLLLAILIVVTTVVAIPVGFITNVNYALAVIAIPFTVFLWWCRYIVRSQLAARYEALWVSVGSVGTSLFQFGFLYFTPFEDSLVYGDFAAVILAGLVPLFMLPRATRTRFRDIWQTKVTRPFISEMMVTVRPNWASGQVYALVNTFSDVWSRVQFGAAGLGSYSATTMIWQFALKPMDYLGQAVLPGLIGAKEHRQKLYREVMCLCIVTFPLFGAMVATGSPLLLKVMHVEDKYPEVVSLLMIMAASLPIAVFQTIHNQLAIAAGNSRFSLYAQLAQLGASALAALALTQPFGLAGLVLASDLGVAANAAALYLLMRKDENASDVFRSAWWSLAGLGATIAAMVPFYLLRAHEWAWLCAFLVVPIYVPAMFALGIVGRPEIERVRGVIAARRAARAAR